MRIDSAILSNAIITASAENPIVSGSSQVNITNTTGYSTFSSSIKTYADAKVAGIVNSAPATLDTLDELAAALGDDANMSASFATTLGTKLPTATHTAFSSSNASALRTEYAAGDSALSSSAHTQRAAIDAKISALDATYATDASVSSLSASAHTRREEISASLDATIDALDSLGISTDTERGALSSSAHTQRVALNSAQTTANNTLSSSIATALRAEITSGDAAFLTSASIGATINDNAVKLSGIESGATADQSDSEIKTAYENNSDTNAFTDALLSKLNAIEASADVTDTTNVVAALSAGSNISISAGGEISSTDTNTQLTNEQVQDIVGAMVTGNTESGITVTYQDGDGTIDFSVASQTDENFTTADHAKLDGIEAGADVTDTTNVTAAGALMDSELTDLAGVKAVTISTLQPKPSEGAFADGDKTKLDGIEANADVTDATNVTAAGALMDSELTNLAAVKAINQGLTTTSAVTFGSGLISNDFTIDGNLTVRGDTIQADVTNLNVEDKNILIASGAANSEAADGAGITIDGADESLTWDHGNSRFNFSDDLHVVGNITVSGNVDGRDIATDGTKLDGIEASADVTDTTNVTAAGALMDSECTSLADVKALDQSVISGADPTFGTANMTDSTNKRFMTDAQETKLDSVESNADVTDTTNVVAALTAGSNITISAGGEISSTDTNTTYSVGDGGLTENNFTNALKTKLDGIEASADVTDTTNVVAALSAGSNISISAGGEISATDTNTTYSAGDGISLSGTTFSITKGTSGDWWGDKVAHVASDGVMEIGRYIDFHGTDGNTDDYTVRLDGLSDTLAVSGHITSTGNITATGDVTAYSDETLKKDVKTIEGALDKTKELRGVEFTRIADDSKSIGVIAQELEKVLPELVSTDDEGIKSVNYAQITGLLIEAVKELSAKVEELSK